MDMDSKDIGAIIREARENRGLSQAKFGALIGVKQASIQAVEKGETARSKYLPEIARELGIPPERVGLPPEQTQGQQMSTLPPIGSPYAPKDFQVYSAVEGGLGEIYRSSEPVDWWPRPIEVQQVKGAYGMYVVGESMVPEFKPGHVAVVNPNLPHIGGKPYIFYGETEPGQVRATLKELRRYTEDHWYVRQHNPPEGQKQDFTLSRKIWRDAHRIVGRQDPS